MRVKIGIVGCGDIAQVHHLPWLTELAEEFEVKAVCDVSKKAAEYLRDWFKVPELYTDYRRLVNADVDAVLLCHTDPKTEVALAALKAGKHVFIEKPVCLSVQDVDLLLEEQAKQGVVVQTGYMKLFEPAYEYALAEAKKMDDISLVEIRHIHPNNKLHVNQFRTRKFDDISESIKSHTNDAREKSFVEALGETSRQIKSAYMTLAGSVIHDTYGLRTIMGMPEKVLHTEIWGKGDYSKAISTMLAYPSGARSTITWIDLPDLWDFDETLRIYGDKKRLSVSYATGFSKNQSSVVVQEIDENGVSQRKEPLVDWESPFRRELRHFHAVINGNKENRAPLSNARLDVSLNVDIIRSYIEKSEVDVTLRD